MLTNEKVLKWVFIATIAISNVSVHFKMCSNVCFISHFEMDF